MKAGRSLNDRHWNGAKTRGFSKELGHANSLDPVLHIGQIFVLINSPVITRSEDREFKAPISFQLTGS